MKSEKIVGFLNEIGTIMYVGGILSHIVIGNVLGHPEAITAYHVSIYKELSAYILILPGLGLKVICDLTMYFQFKVKANWLKLKLLMLLFLSVNAFVFLVPMMPELVALAEQSLSSGTLSQEFLDKAHIELLVGISNVIPLILELVLGSFKPALFKERRNPSVQ